MTPPRHAWVALACLFAAACGRAESTSHGGPPPVVVEAVTVEPTTIEDELDLVGQLEADESVVIKPEIDGVVDTIAFDEGQEIEAGALILRLRDDERRAALAEAEADRVMAERAYDRARTLATDGVLAASEIDRLIGARDAARAREQRARVRLERTAIRAPFAGVLGRRFVSPGDRVERETALVQIDAVARLKLVFTLPEVVLRAVRDGMEVVVHVAPWPDEGFAGEVYFVAPTVDPQTRRLLAKAYVPNPERRLRPGLFANVDLEVGRREGALVVPESALVQDAGGTFVWRIGTDGAAARAPVTLGLRRDGRVEVATGLQPGDRVVSAGTHKVAAGAPVRVATEEAAAGAHP